MDVNQADLIELQRRAALGTMCAALAHEVKSPLGCAEAALRGALERVGPGTPLAANAALAEELGLALRSVGLASAVLDDALGLALPADAPGVTDLSRDASSMIGLVGYLRPRGVSIESAMEPEVRVCGASTHVRQIVLNLLLNACRALGEAERPGTVRVVTLAPSPGSARLRVEDDGPGIPPHLQDRLFEPFVAARWAGGGAGLGLHVVKRITDMLGASVQVHSPPQGGTCVVIDFPPVR